MKAKEFIEKYGHSKVKFAYYYKYRFTFIGEHEGNIITVYVGGVSEDIYKFSVEGGKEYEVNELPHNKGIVKEGEVVIAEYADEY